MSDLSLMPGTLSGTAGQRTAGKERSGTIMVERSAPGDRRSSIARAAYLQCMAKGSRKNFLPVQGRVRT